MLNRLKVKNIALIDDVEIEFNKGLNILSGETGAGKSILIESVYLILGNKLNKNLIRTGKEYLYVELVFNNINLNTKNILSEEGIDVSGLDEIVLSRKVSKQKSTCYVDGEIVPLKTLTRISNSLINLHAQQEQIELKNEKSHLYFLDLYGDDKHNKNISDLNKLYAKYNQLNIELLTLVDNKNISEHDKNILEHELNEIDSANLVAGEDIELEEKYKSIKSIEDIRQLVNFIDNSIDKSSGLSDIISDNLKAVNNLDITDENIDNLKSNLLTIEDLISQTRGVTRDIIRSVDINEEEEERIKQRLDTLNYLKSKYNKDTKELINYLDELKTKYSLIEDTDDFIKNKEKEVKDCYNSLLELANTVSKNRYKLADSFKKELSNQLKDLGFLQSEFEISFSKLDTITSNGIDDVCFVISLNPGEPLKPLASVASGGEISRIMLAVKIVLGNKYNIETLVFDEIDTGISGATAEMVGRKLALLSDKCQIICITHLAQIAAFGDANYLIHKQTCDNKTFTLVSQLDENKLIDELARIIGGINIADDTKKTAKALRNNSMKYKSEVR